MKRLLTGLLLVAVLAGTAAAAAAKPERVLAVEWQAGGGKLRWVSPTTMRPIGSAVLNVGGAPAGVVARSPDGALAAIGGGENGRLRFVRLDGLRPAGLMWLGGASVFKGIWSAPDRLVVLVGGETAEVVVVDPAARRVLHREPLPGIALGVVRAGNRLLDTARAARPDRHGAARRDRRRRDGANCGPRWDLGGIRAAGRGRSGGAPGLARPRRERLAGGRGRRRPPGRGPARDDGRDRQADRQPHDPEGVEARPRLGQVGGLAARGHGRLLGLDDGVGRTGLDRRPPPERRDRNGADAGRIRDRGGARRQHAPHSTAATRSAATASTARGGSRVLQGTDTGYVQTAGHWAYVGSGNSTRFAVVDVRSGRVVGHVRTRETDHHLRSLDSPDGDGAAGRRGRRRRDRPDPGRDVARRLHRADARRGDRGASTSRSRQRLWREGLARTPWLGSAPSSRRTTARWSASRARRVHGTEAEPEGAVRDLRPPVSLGSRDRPRTAPVRAEECDALVGLRRGDALGARGERARRALLPRPPAGSTTAAARLDAVPGRRR